MPAKKATSVIVRRVDLKVVLTVLPLLERVPTARLYCVTPNSDEILIRSHRDGGFTRVTFYKGSTSKSNKESLATEADVIESIRNTKFVQLILVNDALNASKPLLTLWKLTSTEGKKPREKADVPEKAVKKAAAPAPVKTSKKAVSPGKVVKKAETKPAKDAAAIGSKKKKEPSSEAAKKKAAAKSPLQKEKKTKKTSKIDFS